MAELTAGAVLRQVDALLPNGYTDEEKRRWLTQAEGFVCGALYGMDAAAMETLGDDTPLRAPAPHHELYRHYVEAQIHYANGEMSRYNNAAAMWNNGLVTLRDALCRQKGGGEPVRALRFM